MGYNEQDDFRESKALMAGQLAHGVVLEAIFPTSEQAERALLALAEAGFEDAALETARPEDVRRASVAANAVQSAPSAEQPDAAASSERAAPLIANPAENGGVRVIVSPGTRMDEAKRILREHGHVNR